MAVKTLFFTALVAFSSSASAANALYWCNGCNEVANAVLVGSGCDREVFMGDLQQRTLHKYRVYWIGDSRADRDCDKGKSPTLATGHWDVINQTSHVTAEEKKAFDSMVKFYYTAPVGWHKTRYFQIVDPAHLGKAN